MSTTVKIYGFALSDGSGIISTSKRDYVELDITIELDDDIDEEVIKDVIYGTLRECGVRGMLRDQRVAVDKITIGYQPQTTIDKWLPPLPERPEPFTPKKKREYPKPRPDLASQYEPVRIKSKKTGEMILDQKKRSYVHKETGEEISRRAWLKLKGVVPEEPAKERKKRQAWERWKEQEKRYAREREDHTLEGLANKIREAVKPGLFKVPRGRTRLNKSHKTKSDYKKEYERL